VYFSEKKVGFFKYKSGLLHGPKMKSDFVSFEFADTFHEGTCQLLVFYLEER